MRLEQIADMFTGAGPFLSVYVDVTRQTADGAQEVETRWKDARKKALDQGAPADLVDRVGERVLEPTGEAGANARFVVAGDDRVLLDDVVRTAPHAEVVHWSPLPDLGAWLADRDLDLPVLVVVADREGADLALHRPWPADRTEESTVEAVEDQVHKARTPRSDGRFGGSSGGPSGEWLRSDVQRWTEEVWRKNAREVAAEIDRLSGRVRLIVLAGDTQACARIREALSRGAEQLLVMLDDGSRAEGASLEHFEHDVRKVVRDKAVAERLEVVRDYQERLGRGGACAAGARDVLGAAVLGQVQTLLLDPDTAAEAQVRPEDVPGLTLPAGVDPAQRMRADQVAVAAAARTDAEVCVTGPSVLPGDGIAALLRWEQ